MADAVRTPHDLLDYDKLPRLEAKVAFIAMAASAMSMLNVGDYSVLESQKAWEGLGWITEEISEDLHNWVEQAEKMA